jgi:fumarylacetoacetase
MNTQLNETHNPSLNSFIVSANDGVTDFPIQNLPFAVFRRAGSREAFRGGVAIGDQVLDLAALSRESLLTGDAAVACNAAAQPTLNALMTLGHSAWSALRLALSRALRLGSTHQEKLAACLVAQTEIEFAVPAQIGDYTDFFTSIHHATNVGKLFRPDNPLLPNYQWVPIAYHGRASSIGVSGQQLHRPVGQVCGAGQTVPTVQASKRLDYELEVGIWVGSGNAQGTRISVNDAEAHVFGVCLLNDWSARDVQAWEYQPLGPFLAKNFGTTISPWIVTMEALAPFRAPFTRAADHPQPLPYLESIQMREAGAVNMQLEVHLHTAEMRAQNLPAQCLGRSNFSDSYWTVSQMLAHHTVGGCNLQPGDLFGSGTMSGATPDSLGSLLELTEGGKKPVTLANGQTRTFLEDGDTVVLTAHCESPTARRIGLGRCAGTVLAAVPL